MPVRLADMRRMVAQDLRDVVVVEASGGSTTTLTDPLELVDYDGAQVSSQLLILTGHEENVGRVVRVLGNTRQSGTITFTPELSQPIEAGDRGELYNLRGAGFRVRDYTLAITDICRNYNGYLPMAAVGDPVAFDGDQPELPIPDGWIGVHGVHVITDDGHLLDLRPSRYAGGMGFLVRPDTRTVRIESVRYREGLRGATVTLQGYARRPDVVADDDLIHLDSEWVRRKVAAKLAGSRGDRTSAQWAVEWERMAAGRGPALMMAWEPNTVLLEELA